MRIDVKLLSLFVSAAFVLGCAGILGELEGDDINECENDADDDADGLFDCTDPDCATASACTEAESDVPEDDTAESDGGEDFLAYEEWINTGVKLVLEGRDGSYRFGIAETGAADGGWFGEDCLDGQGQYDLCHDEIDADETILDSVEHIEDVVANESTLFSRAIAEDDGLTYVVISNRTDECWTWGDDPGYYEELGCEEYDRR